MYAERVTQGIRPDALCQPLPGSRLRRSGCIANRTRLHAGKSADRAVDAGMEQGHDIIELLNVGNVFRVQMNQRRHVLMDV